MLPEQIKRRAMDEARKLNVSFADFVRQAISEKLPRPGKGIDHLKRRRADPVFRLLDRLPLASEVAATDVAQQHDDYLYGDTPRPAER